MRINTNSSASQLPQSGGRDQHLNIQSQLSQDFIQGPPGVQSYKYLQNSEYNHVNFATITRSPTLKGQLDGRRFSKRKIKHGSGLLKQYGRNSDLSTIDYIQSQSLNNRPIDGSENYNEQPSQLTLNAIDSNINNNYNPNSNLNSGVFANFQSEQHHSNTNNQRILNHQGSDLLGQQIPTAILPALSNQKANNSKINLGESHMMLPQSPPQNLNVSDKLLKMLETQTTMSQGLNHNANHSTMYNSSMGMRQTVQNSQLNFLPFAQERDSLGRLISDPDLNSQIDLNIIRPSAEQDLFKGESGLMGTMSSLGTQFINPRDTQQLQDYSQPLDNEELLMTLNNNLRIITPKKRHRRNLLALNGERLVKHLRGLTIKANSSRNTIASDLSLQLQFEPDKFQSLMNQIKMQSTTFRVSDTLMENKYTLGIDQSAFDKKSRSNTVVKQVQTFDDHYNLQNELKNSESKDDYKAYLEIKNKIMKAQEKEIEKKLRNTIKDNRLKLEAHFRKPGNQRSLTIMKGEINISNGIPILGLQRMIEQPYFGLKSNRHPSSITMEKRPLQSIFQQGLTVKNRLQRITGHGQEIYLQDRSMGHGNIHQFANYQGNVSRFAEAERVFDQSPFTLAYKKREDVDCPRNNNFHKVTNRNSFKVVNFNRQMDRQNKGLKTQQQIEDEVLNEEKSDGDEQNLDLQEALGISDKQLQKKAMKLEPQNPYLVEDRPAVNRSELLMMDPDASFSDKADTPIRAGQKKKISLTQARGEADLNNVYAYKKNLNEQRIIVERMKNTINHMVPEKEY